MSSPHLGFEMAKKRIRKNQATSVIDAEEETPTAASSKEVEDQIAAIRAMKDLETNRFLTSLRLLSSYFTEEQLMTPVLEYFEQNLSNLVIVRNEKDDHLDVHWKTNHPDATDFSTLMRPKQTTRHRMSVGMSPNTLRLPKKGKMILSVRGSPLGFFHLKEDNMEAINGALSCSSFVPLLTKEELGPANEG